MADTTDTTVAAALAQAIRSVAEKAQNEEELRIGVEKLLEPALQQLGIHAQPEGYCPFQV